jgi:aspartate/methionine/tyrosine aminotransferase
MAWNPLAQELNHDLEQQAPAVLEMLSDLGKRFYFPRGIITQSAEAKEKATRFNATIGIALEHGDAMHLRSFREQLPGLEPKEAFTYAPVAGKPELRERWRQKQLEENPTLRGKATSVPIVTSALTHGLSLVSELFIDPGDVILLPDQLWGNYRLTFEVRQQGKIETFPFFRGEAMDLGAFEEALRRLAGQREKLLVVLNFPNNPSGYTPTPAEAERLVNALAAVAAGGTRLVVVCDDAYFNLVFDAACLQESVFGHLAGVHENLLAVRLDGATKEHFVWGFRVGFITFAAGGSGDLARVHGALEKKTAGLIRAGVSSSPHVSQSLILKALDRDSFRAEQAEKRDILRQRAERVREIVYDARYASAWEPYPFNSGYFHCLRLKQVEAEALRVHLLDAYGLGVIATGPTDIRVAFSCLEAESLPEVYETIFKGIRDLDAGS